MSINIVEEQIKKFLADETPGVLAICGKWGVGKTHFWEDVIKSVCKDSSKFALPRYAYVSLFGIGSLVQLKNELFTQSVDRSLIGKELKDIDIFNDDAWSSIKTALKKLGKTASSVGVERFLKNSSSIVDSVCFSSISKTLFCLDDLERLSESVNLRDVLGLASLLKEQKKCKIVFLLNDGEDGLEDFEKFHEKVVDVTLRFEPTAEECAEIALKGKSDAVKFLRDCVCRLNLTNIRTIKKIERVVNIAVPLLKKYDQEVTDQAINSIALFGWCNYRAQDEKIPPIDYVIKNRDLLLGLSRDNSPTTKDERTESEKKRQWDNRIRDYGYQVTDELDLALLKGVTDGYFLEDDLSNAACDKHEAILASRARNSFHNAWIVSHESFANDLNEVVATLYKSFKDNIENVPLNSFNAMVMLFRDLGEDDKANKAIDLYVESRDPTNEVFDLGS